MENDTVVVISFCIQVYNQSEFLRECIESIVEYKGKDIEIIVNDNCSTEDIKTVVERFSDDRLIYYRNDKNLGLDGNILIGMSRAKGSYVFLLRTKDHVIASRIPHMIQMVRDNPSIVYMQGSALDEENHRVVNYKSDAIYKKGKEARKAHKMMYVHPSGNLFKNNLISYKEIYDFIINRYNIKQIFVAHELIRMQYVTMGDFCTIQEPNWVLASVKLRRDVSVNIDKEYVYSPKFVIEAIDCEARWAGKIFSGKEMLKEWLRLINNNYATCTYRYYGAWKKKHLKVHYGKIKNKPDIVKERKLFLEELRNLEVEFNVGAELVYYLKKWWLISGWDIWGIFYMLSCPFHNVVKKILRIYT